MRDAPLTCTFKAITAPDSDIAIVITDGVRAVGALRADNPSTDASPSTTYSSPGIAATDGGGPGFFFTAALSDSNGNSAVDGVLRFTLLLPADGATPATLMDVSWDGVAQTYNSGSNSISQVPIDITSALSLVATAESQSGLSTLLFRSFNVTIAPCLNPVALSPTE